MSKLTIPHDAFVFVGDGRKALFLRNAGDECSIRLSYSGLRAALKRRSTSAASFASFSATSSR
jgi:hypothetical protein